MGLPLKGGGPDDLRSARGSGLSVGLVSLRWRFGGESAVVLSSGEPLSGGGLVLGHHDHHGRVARGGRPQARPDIRLRPCPGLEVRLVLSSASLLPLGCRPAQTESREVVGFRG